LWLLSETDQQPLTFGRRGLEVKAEGEAGRRSIWIDSIKWSIAGRLLSYNFSS
jgi:hypothetical protein